MRQSVITSSPVKVLPFLLPYRRIILCLLLLHCILPGAGQPASISTIAFGSCSHQDDPNQMWTDVIGQKPDLWIWLGDNIYGDTHDPAVLKAQYDMQKAEPSYQALLQTCPVIGTWDDHDYGVNDGGKYFSKKNESKKAALDFLDVPPNAAIRKRPGMYDVYSYGSGDRIVKIILLDTRSFRDTLMLSQDKDSKYELNTEGDILGEAQWAWLEKELKKSDAAIHIIGSSIQFIPDEHGFEKWGNFPKARQRMLDLLVKEKPNNTFFISGDRHIGEISKMTVPGLPYALYDFTSSGLTHTWDEPHEEKSSYRLGQQIQQKNFGIIKINWNTNLSTVEFEIRGRDNVLWQSIPVRF